MPSGIYTRTKDMRTGLHMLGRTPSIETREKIASSLKGHKFWGKVMDEEQRRAISEGQKRVVAEGRHNFWKGGITPINKTIRKSLEYKLWRESVFKRDNYTCLWCGAKSGNGQAVFLHPDHIKPFSLFPDLRFILSNGRTLCEPCHRKTDTYANRLLTYQKTNAI